MNNNSFINMSQEIVKQCEQALSTATNVHDLENIKAHFLGKNGIVTQKMQSIKITTPEEKKTLGQELNSIKGHILEQINSKRMVLEEVEFNNKLQAEVLDVTMPARLPRIGSIHPISQVYDEMMQIFTQFGFSVASGPNIEDDEHNFSALNFAEHHPARTMHDTFYLKSRKLLRTHTSTVQIREMRSGEPPFKLVAFGRTYRSDSDMTHTPMFHQIEGLVIDEKTHMGHMKSFLHKFVELFFEQKVNVRLRPSYFPFTEPSAEMDISMPNNPGKWLEVMGCGMVHPNVLENVGVDPTKYQGFAFGLGVERFAMLKYGMQDLRQFFAGDQRWVNHYNFSAFDIPSIIGGLTR